MGPFWETQLNLYVFTFQDKTVWLDPNLKRSDNPFWDPLQLPEQSYRQRYGINDPLITDNISCSLHHTWILSEKHQWYLILHVKITANNFFIQKK